MGIPSSLFTLSWRTSSIKTEISTHIHNCVDSLFSLSSILKNIIHQERLQQIHRQCVGISSSLFPLSWWTPSIKREWSAHIQNAWGFLFLSSLYLDKHHALREWTREWTKHIHNVCEFLVYPFLYLDKHRSSRENEARARARTHAHTHTHMCGFPYLFQLSW